ncbi:TonB-dependent receptor plug domain-containing protein, partial [Salmonella enterica]|uniref:TonB-dependent receptor plug domain-containing protein n=1 Tax=Salmonella enterica TaxID=28901 RepID=UPI003F4B5629
QGVWTWTATAGSVTARYGSIRGASSFGVSAPKIYLDGIEVANPLLVTQLDPNRVARVEVIRGPQGAALYGADAISGVVNILTRL